MIRIDEKTKVKVEGKRFKDTGDAVVILVVGRGDEIQITGSVVGQLVSRIQAANEQPITDW